MVTPRPLAMTTQSGLKLHASEWSNHNAPVCLLLHGFAHDGRAWDPLSLALRERYHVIALDFRGHGESSWDSSRSYCHKALMEDLETLVEQLNLRRFHLVGHSMGARVAILYTAAHNDTICSLTIVDTGPEVGLKGANRIRTDAEQQPRYFDTREAYFQWLRTRLPLANRESLRQRAQHGLKAVNGRWQPKTDPEFARILWRQDNNDDTHNEDAMDQQTNRSNPDKAKPVVPLTQELWEALDRIDAPTLVVRGQLSSILMHDTALSMAEQRLSSGQLQTIPKAGHAVMIDNPRACSEAISEFIHTTQKASDFYDDQHSATAR
jgi:esterase